MYDIKTKDLSPHLKMSNLNMSLNIPTCLNIPDDFKGYDKDLFHYPERYRDIVDKILVPHAPMRSKSSLRREGEGHIGYSVQFVRAKSYQNDCSTGIIKISGEEYLENELKGHDVLIVEDIIDTGATMVKLLESLKKYNPNSIKVASLVRKRTVSKQLFQARLCVF
ncbi:hprT [Lepeophtheirus salmonis]|uniref:HprT n=1 Tax=Lepeophtheirus salmonis TaxID=72036 RepID=A0A7R8CAT9_LEPSM|nr:hprT [Lepeophtheirus salmonis]CAF2754304.1 hprT [Lepeophtheirus salmonis]